MNDNQLIFLTIILIILLNIPLFLDFFLKKDHNEEKNNIKKIVISIGSIFLSLVFIFLVFIPIEFANSIKNSTVLFLYPIFISVYLLIRIITYFTNYIKVIKSNDKSIYVRDVNVDYSPAVLSLLINHKIENRKDFNATILNIHAKKVIKFNRTSNQNLEILDLKNEAAINQLTKDELYVYHVLIQKEQFNKEKWHQIVKEELEKKKFVKVGQKNIIFLIIRFYAILFGIALLLFILFVLAVLLIPGDYFKNMATIYFNHNIILSIFWILILTPFQLLTLEAIMSINKRKYLKDLMNYYTEIGALELLRWKKFKSFINDFSMISDAPVESVILWEKYLAYAMAININKKYNSTELKEINKAIQSFKWS